MRALPASPSTLSVLYIAETTNNFADKCWLSLPLEAHSPAASPTLPYSLQETCLRSAGIVRALSRKAFPTDILSTSALEHQRGDHLRRWQVW
jgi:hypothetical protein